MKIYDLSQTIAGGMPVYPGDPPTEITPLATAEEDGYNLSKLSMSPHSGTHLDAPYHFMADGKGADGVPLSQCVGPALMISLPKSGGVIDTEAMFKKVDENRLPEEKILLIRTDHGRLFGDERYYTEAPVFDMPLGDALRKRGFNAVGADLPSVTLAGGRIKDGHVDILARGIVIIENLRLQEFTCVHSFFSAAPIKIKQGDGAPVRAYAVEGCDRGTF